MISALGPQLHQIKLPLPFELREVNVHLVRGEDGYTLIDTGYYAEECFAALEAGLRELRVQWTDIRHLVLTHMHPDHMGNAHRILDLTGGATLSMHTAEEKHLRSIAEAGRAPWFQSMMRLAGTPTDLEEQVHEAFSYTRQHIRALKPDVLFNGGERCIEDRFEVVHTPGHSPGHICLFDRRLRMLTSGDHMLPGITPNISWLPGEDMLDQYLHSLLVVEPLDVDTVVPSHGRPFDGHRSWIRQTAEHHRERRDTILRAITDRPASAHDIVGHVWERKLAPFHYQFAVSEVLAHLEYMQRRGEVKLELSANPPAWGRL